MTRLVVAVALASTWSGCSLSGPRADKAVTTGGEDGLHLVLRLGERRLYVMGDDSVKAPESYPVAIGKKGYETPTGRFQINEMVKDPDWLVFDFKNPSRQMGRIPPGPNNPLGKRWIGFGTSPHGWEVGFHGTPKPQLLGQAVSHGCVRMRNEDVIKVFDKVRLGTVVLVEK